MSADKMVTLGDRLRGIMSTVDQLEKTTGHGGWYAEHIQELCDAIARDAGIRPYREGFGPATPLRQKPLTQLEQRTLDRLRSSGRSA